MAGHAGPPGAPIGGDAFLQHCFGAGEKELNLGAVRARAVDLHRTLQQLLQDIVAHGAGWAPLLDTLAVVNVQHMQLSEQLRALLKVYTLHPKGPGDAQLLAQAAPELPMLLASKLLPEMEAADEVLLAARGVSPAARASLGPSHLEAAQEALGVLHARVAFLTTAIMGDDASGILDAKGPERRKVEANSRAIQRALQAQQQVRSGKTAGAEESDRAKRPRLDGPGAAAAAAAATAAASRDQLLRNLMSGAAFKPTQAAGAAAR